MEPAPTRIEMIEKICMPLNPPFVSNMAPMIGRPVRDLCRRFSWEPFHQKKKKKKSEEKKKRRVNNE